MSCHYVGVNTICEIVIVNQIVLVTACKKKKKSEIVEKMPIYMLKVLDELNVKD